jgi:hypothetical protein
MDTHDQDFAAERRRGRYRWPAYLLICALPCIAAVSVFSWSREKQQNRSLAADNRSFATALAQTRSAASRSS